MKRALPFVFLLSACSTFQNADSSQCPAYAFVGDLTRYPLELSTQQGEVTVLQVSANCTARAMNFVIRTQSKLERTPEKEEKLSIPYFIAILNEQETILSKTERTFSYALNHALDIQTQKVSYDLPEGFNPKHHRVLMGFSLTAKQRDLNKKAVMILEKKKI